MSNIQPQQPRDFDSITKHLGVEIFDSKSGLTGALKALSPKQRKFIIALQKRQTVGLDSADIKSLKGISITVQKGNQLNGSSFGEFILKIKNFVVKLLNKEPMGSKSLKAAIDSYDKKIKDREGPLTHAKSNEEELRGIQREIQKLNPTYVVEKKDLNNLSMSEINFAIIQFDKDIKAANSMLSDLQKAAKSEKIQNEIHEEIAFKGKELKDFIKDKIFVDNATENKFLKWQADELGKLEISGKASDGQLKNTVNHDELKNSLEGFLKEANKIKEKDGATNADKMSVFTGLKEAKESFISEQVRSPLNKERNPFDVRDEVKEIFDKALKEAGADKSVIAYVKIG